jgi:hypothetical protein
MARVVTGSDVMLAAREIMLTPFVWGEADCCTGACDVFLRLYGVDPMSALRGTYGSQAEADAAVGAFGGFVELCEALAGSVGLIRAEGPTRAGDIGVTAAGVHEPDRRALAVAAGPAAWVCKSPRGFTIVESVARSWRL